MAPWAAMFRNGTLFAVMVALSCLSFVFLAGLYANHGSLLPSTKGAGASEELQIWLSWSALVAAPVITALWILRLTYRGRQ